MSPLRTLYPVRSLTLSFLFLDSIYYTNTKLLHNFNFMLNYLFYIFNKVAKNEELGLELVTLLNTKEKLQSDKEAVELETMKVEGI